MRFSGAGIYFILILYIIVDRIIALYIYLIRPKIILYIDAIILISAAIYRSILFFIVLIYIFLLVLNLVRYSDNFDIRYY
jgi:hypothetical protein